MNTKRIIFWVCFVVVLGLILWGLAVAMNKPTSDGLASGQPAPITEVDHVRGPANAAVTLVEYSDLQCPACRSYYPIVEALVAEASTTLRFVYRHYPLYPMHKHSMVAAYAAEAAGAQGKFWEMVGVLFENQTTWGNAAAAAPIIEGYAQELGLDMAKYRVDVESQAVKDRVQRDRDEGISIGVMGTPTFFVNGKAIHSPQTYDEFKAVIEAAASVNTN